MLYIAIIFVIIIIIIEKYMNKNIIEENNNNYLILRNPMTETEIKFLKELKNITDKYNLIILPQIQLQRIFKTYNKNDVKSFNKIKSKSIDFAIVDQNYNYKIFIELDDYTHNRKKRIERDNFINKLFNNYNLILIRIKVSNKYNLEEIENIIKEVV